RRGRFAGLAQALNQLEASARRDSSGPILTQIELLRARFELSRGLQAMALGILAARESSTKCSRRQSERESRVLKARALGWLGRTEECRALAKDFSHEDWSFLEPEEKPALVALSGDLRGASEVASKGCWKTLWKALERPSMESAYGRNPFDVLEPFRAARLVLDIELTRPGSSPARWVRQAESCFRNLGAAAFAAKLDRARRASWRVLTDYLGSSSTGGETAVRRLLEDAGYFDTRLIWRHGSHRKVLIPGAGGSQELSACFGRGELLLRADRVDAPLRALFAFVAREYRPSAAEPRRAQRGCGLVGDSDELMRSLTRLERLARRDLAVLIRGETGTGKELAARQVHRLSDRAALPFVAVNCAALSESLLLSELFGHARGAFTGADRSRAGIFESAAGGTVFLDEIGDLPLMAQAKLLRVLQEGEVRRLGESQPRSVDIRVVAATHRNLESMMQQGDFRRDVYYRLAAGVVELPPLRQRDGDALTLAEHFLSQQGYSMTTAAGQRLLSYSWPGNVRELKNVIELAIALCEGTIVDVNHLELPQDSGDSMIGYHRQVEDFRRNLVREALRASDGRKSEAARRLNVSRQALSYLARTLGVE
ncbi:MAG: sigma 54-interacting transcriptional regulator, partial [Acidobacteriota bacterium]